MIVKFGNPHGRNDVTHNDCMQAGSGVNCSGVPSPYGVRRTFGAGDSDKTIAWLDDKIVCHINSIIVRRVELDD